MIDSSQWRNSGAYRTQARAEVDAQRAALMLPRTARTGPQMASAAMIRISAKQGLDVRGMTASEAANALKEHTRPQPNAITAAEMAANEAECLRVFGPI
jgi:hypothetical protein